MRTWTSLLTRGLFYGLLIVLMLPLLALFRADPRIDYAEDMAYGEDR